MAKKETLTTSAAIQTALAEGLQTPEEIQVHLRKQGLDLGTADISYHKGRIQAEQARPVQTRPTVADNAVPVAVLSPAPENGKPPKAATPKPPHHQAGA